MEQPTTLRPITTHDKPFLYRLYASTREDEMAMVPWSEAEKETFLTSQFNAQHTFYHQQFVEAEFLIIGHDMAFFTYHYHKTSHLFAHLPPL